MLRTACLLAVVLGSALAALADIPPPPPEAGFKRVPYEHVVKLDKEIPGYKFYTFRGSVGGGATVDEELKLETTKATPVPGSSSPSFWTGVVAVPVKVLDELKTSENLAKQLSRENEDKRPAGMVVYLTRGTSRDLKTTDPRSKVENVITISADDKAGVKFTAAEDSAAPGKNTSSDTTTPPSGMLLGGVALSLAFISSGLLWFRRK